MPVSNILIAFRSQITLEHTAYPQYFPLTENQSMFVIEFGSNQKVSFSVVVVSELNFPKLGA